MRQLRPPSLLEELGLSGAQRAAVLGSLVGRMAAPASERAAWHWLPQRSALDEPLGCDCETMGRNALHHASDRLLRHRDTIETRLFQRAADLFDLQAMPTALDALPEAAVVLDRGLATEGNVAWLRERSHQCLVARRERRRVFDESRAVAIGTAGGQRMLACAETDGNGETRLRCASAQRAAKERAMAGQAGARLETALRTLHEGLSRQGTTRPWRRSGSASDGCRPAIRPPPRTARSTCRPTTGAATRRRWPGSGSRWRAAGRPIPGSTACAPTASAGTPSGCGAPA